MAIGIFSNITAALCRAYAATIPRPFAVRYNPYTESVEFLDKLDKLKLMASDIKAEVTCLCHAVNKLSE